MCDPKIDAALTETLKRLDLVANELADVKIRLGQQAALVNVLIAMASQAFGISDETLGEYLKAALKEGAL